MKTKNSGLNRLPWGFIAFCIVPSVALTFTFIFIPTVRAVLLSFQNVGALSMKGKYIGLENYAYLVKDKYFIQAFFNTVKVIFVVPILTIFTAFILAFILQQSKLKEKNLYIIIYFLPNAISSTVLAIIWSYVYHPTSGILNNILGGIGLNALKRTWLGDKNTALWCIAATIWISCFGYYMILHLAGMDSIQPELYESAKLDGAGFWTQFFKITFPLMKNIIGITFVMNMGGVLGASFVYSKIMTDGGPNGASNVLLRYVYQQGILNGQMGYSSCITVITLALSIVLSIIARRLTRQSR